MIATLLGTVRIAGAYYRCEACGHGESPYSLRVGLGGGCASEGLGRAAMLLAVGHAYEQGSRLLEALTGQRLSAETIRRMVLRLGGQESDQEASRAGQMAEWKPPKAESQPPRLFTAVDGVMVGFRDGFHEVKLAVCYGKSSAREIGSGCEENAEKQFGRSSSGSSGGPPPRSSGSNPPKSSASDAPRSFESNPPKSCGRNAERQSGRRCAEPSEAMTCRRYVGRLEGAETFRSYAWSAACQTGLETASVKVLLGDGAAWIWDQVGGVLGEDVIHIVDWYHAMEHVWTCGRALHGEGTPQTRAWVKGMENLLWEGSVRQMVARLEAERAEVTEVAQREALAALMTYLQNQDARLAYDRFRAQGLDIGSGQVEGACKNVVASRLKGSGMRWSPGGAQAMLSLRCCWLNGDWDALWSRHPLAA